MTIARTLPTLRFHAPVGVERVRFVQQRLAAVSYPGSELPRGYFCSVTPP